MQAINDGKVDLLRELAAKSVPLETKSPFGHTPLEAACFRKNADVVESLIRSVSQSVSQNEDRVSRFSLLYKFKSRSGVSLKAASSGAKSPLACAAYSGDLQIFEMLVNQGSNGKL